MPGTGFTLTTSSTATAMLAPPASTIRGMLARVPHLVEVEELS